MSFSSENIKKASKLLSTKNECEDNCHDDRQDKWIM